MKTKLLFLVVFISNFCLAQIPTIGLDSEYKFSNGSLNDTFSTKNLAQTGNSLNTINDRFSGATNSINLSGDYLQRTSLQGLTNMSISFWVKTSTNDGNIRTIIDQTERNSPANTLSQKGWYAYLQNGKVGLYANYLYRYQASGGNTVTGNTGYYNLTTTTNIADNNWHHVVILIKGRTYFWQSSDWLFENEYTIYIDNVLKNTYLHNYHTWSTGWADQPNTFPNVPVTIGNNQLGNLTTTNNYSDGIDDIRVYKGTILNVANVNSLFLENPLTRFYVNPTATGANNGSSWTNAYTSLQTALSSANNQEIWIASGTYKPHTSSRTVPFTIGTNNMKLYGGFSGTETQLSERVFGANETILSGDLSGNDDTILSIVNTTRNDNSYNVIYLQGQNCLLDRLTITGGHANGTTNQQKSGAGIYKVNAVTKMTLNNCKIFKNVANDTGGALQTVFDTTASELIVSNCEFTENLAAGGGGIYSYPNNNVSVSYTVSNSLFKKNQAVDTAILGYSGSSLWLRAYGTSSAAVTNIANCTFVDNIDTGTFAGINNFNRATLVLSKRISVSSNHNATISNCILWNNKAVGGITSRPISGLIEDVVNPITIKNSIDETNFTGVTLSGTSTSTSNSNPLFTNTVGGDYTLSSTSPAINTGDNTSVIGSSDLLNNQRIFSTTVDMGAYEYGSVLDINSFANFKDFSIYPNPMASILNIISNEDIKFIEIYSLDSKLILKTTENKIDVSNLSAGLYLIKIMNRKNEIGMKKIIKQ